MRGSGFGHKFWFATTPNNLCRSKAARGLVCQHKLLILLVQDTSQRSNMSRNYAAGRHGVQTINRKIADQHYRWCGAKGALCNVYDGDGWVCTILVARLAVEQTYDGEQAREKAHGGDSPRFRLGKLDLPAKTPSRKDPSAPTSEGVPQASRLGLVTSLAGPGLCLHRAAAQWHEARQRREGHKEALLTAPA